MAILQNRDVAFVCLCIGIHLIYRHYRRISFPLPPGPRRWPIVGSVFSFPRAYAHVYYKNLGEKLGTKILYLETLGRKLIIINDAGVAQDLLEKRSALYSDRPQFPMLTEVADVRHLFASMPYGDEWRKHRRAFQQYFSKNLIPAQERGIEFVRKGLLPGLYAEPSNFHEHLRSCVGGFSTSIAYGLPMKRRHDPLIQKAEEAFTFLNEATSPGRYFVNIIPFLKYVPDWMPGTTFKKDAYRLRRQLLQMLEDPYEMVLKMMADGTQAVSSSFVTESLEARRQAPDYALLVKQTATQLYNAVSETTSAALMTFLLAMLQNPSIQRRAQQEVDSVVGDRLPEFSDIPHLTYLSAIIKEVLRWNPIVPMGLPHMNSDEDVYNGYYIPKGCIVLGNAYAMLHDEEVFPDADKFEPERFIKNGVIRDDILNPEAVATFGFGRRVCPGSQVGLSLVYITASSILALFDITPALDSEGRPIEVTAEFPTASIVSEPRPFPCKLTPRKGKDVEGLLESYMGIEVI